MYMFLAAVFGALELHGIEHDVYWTNLQTTATAGSQTITLKESVDWQVGDEIIITPTGYTLHETERFFITAVDPAGSSLTLDRTLDYTHLGTCTFRTLEILIMVTHTKDLQIYFIKLTFHNLSCV